MTVRKIAIEEHWESDEFATAGDPKFSADGYMAEVRRRLRDVDQRVSIWTRPESMSRSFR